MIKSHQNFPEEKSIAIYPHAQNNQDQCISIFNFQLSPQGFSLFNFYFA
jgi:hypothetical protein